MRLLLRWLVALTLPFMAGMTLATGMGVEDARHLLHRTGFGAAPADLERLARMSREQAVDRLLAEVSREASRKPPAWAGQYERVFRPEMSAEERQQANRRELIERGLELRAWWLAEMLTTPSPLTEKLTLFWHGHFATSQQKVRSAYLMYQQNRLLRRHALGNFGVLLHEIAKDPAMLIYLDGAQNRRGAPNENFAREVMELFTLGEGQYREEDVKEAARAFTGWSLDPERGTFRFRRAQHDPGMKSLFGQRGPYTGEDVIDLLLAQPATAEFIVSKLWREFIGEPSARDELELRRLAELFRASGLELRPLLRELLLSPAFWAPEQRGTMAKSPVDLVVGTLRSLSFSVADPAPLAIALRQMGQDLFGPPNVKGWPGGKHWLTSQTLLTRKAFLDRLFREEGGGLAMNRPAAMGPGETLIDPDLPAQGRQRAQMRRALATRAPLDFDANAWARELGLKDADRHVRLTAYLLALPAHDPSPIREAQDVRSALRALVLDPVYQLK